MDSRRCSAALGFTLLIGCVIGIVILIYNSGSSRRSLDSSGSSSSPMQHGNHHHHHHQHATTVVGGKAAAASGGASSSKSLQDGFANDPNYRSSQPTMQDVNELAELHRLLSSKSKHAAASATTSSGSSSGKGNPVNAGTVTSMKKTNGSTASATSSSSSSATSSVKASITAVNYSSVPKKGSFAPQSSSGGSMTSASNSVSTNSSLPRRNPPLTTSSVSSSRQEVHNLQQNHHNQNSQKAYAGHQSPPAIPPVHRPTTTQMMVDNSEERQALAPPPPHEKNARRGSGGGLAHNDLYTTSWHPSMVSPAGGGIPVVPNHPYHHHHHHLYNHPQQSHRAHINNPQPPRSSSPAKINKTGEKGTGYPLNQDGAAPNLKQYQHGYYHYRQDQEKEDRHKEDGDFIQVDDDDYEDDVSGNLGNLKKEEEWDRDNDVADDNEEAEEEEEDEEWEDEENNGSDPGFLMEPKNLAADLETLFSLANHLYTSPASLLSTFSAQAKTNSTKKTDSSTSTSGLPGAFQGFLKIINETIQRGNNSKLLVELNDMYQGREARMSRAPQQSSSNNGNNRNKSVNQTNGIADEATMSSDVLTNVGDGSQQSPYEKSLTAFVFMSFGVFLLNQIHSFVQKTAQDHLKHHKFMSNDSTIAAAVAGEGRAMPWEEDGPFAWYSPRGDMVMTTEASSLDILFQPPAPPLNNSNTNNSTVSSDFVSGRSNDEHTEVNAVDGKGHMNNMFRALLNIANAYTKESPAVECIWSLYCRDLDETAHKKGLYGVAARINSVGLRLIMKQIPPALTFDVILRSLVGWDGLPCRKMFPECSVGNGTISMVPDKQDNNVVGGEHVATTNVLQTERQTHI